MGHFLNFYSNLTDVINVGHVINAHEGSQLQVRNSGLTLTVTLTPTAQTFS